MNKRLYVLAANDRFNYGDLLFPYIISRYLGQYFNDIKYISTTQSDLSSKGGFKTEAFKSLYNIESGWENHLIVAGGDSLCAEWLQILSYVEPGVAYIKRISGKLSRIGIPVADKFAEKLIRLAYGAKTRFVFSVGKNELPEFKSIVYNSLGGSRVLGTDILNDLSVRKILSSVDYIAVRDKLVGQSLERAGISNAVVPDSAILMSEVFDEQLLYEHLSVSRDLLHEDYIFFQGADYIWMNEYDNAASQLEAIAEMTGCKLCLCPIGTALGHYDQVALRQIAGKLKSEKTLIDDPSIYDIMWLIKHSRLYIGSSLHGTITAMSYGVPYIGYGVNKLKAYIDTWSCDPDHFVNKDTLIRAVKKYYGKTSPCADWKNKVLQSFKEMSELYL